MDFTITHHAKVELLRTASSRKETFMARTTTGKRTSVKAGVKKAASTGSNRRVGTKLLAAQARGHAADAKGLRFEQKVSTYYAKQGWRMQARVLLVGREFDLGGTKKDLLSEENIFIECKDKARVTPSDVLAFLAKLKKLDDRWPEMTAKAVLAHTGELPKDARDAARASPIPIGFKKFLSTQRRR